MILPARLHSQLLAGRQPKTAAAVVAQLCAMQAQDYIGAKWAIGLRGKGLDDAAVEAAFNDGQILRTHVMRPTWHFVTPADIRWMLTLTAPRVHAACAYNARQVRLDAKTLSRAHRVLESELAGGRFRTRSELGAALLAHGIEARGPRLGLLTIHSEVEQVMCSGPVRGRLLTYAALDARAPTATARTPRDPAAELGSRYFAGHGPATVRDFSWWSGLSLTQAQRAIESVTPAMSRRNVDGVDYWATQWERRPTPMPAATFLLPNYDEYVIAYKDRQLVQPTAGRGTPKLLDPFAHPLVVDGLVRGVWRRRVSGRSTRIELVPTHPLSLAQRAAIDRAAERLLTFAGAGVTVDRLRSRG